MKFSVPPSQPVLLSLDMELDEFILLAQCLAFLAMTTQDEKLYDLYSLVFALIEPYGQYHEDDEDDSSLEDI